MATEFNSATLQATDDCSSGYCRRAPMALRLVSLPFAPASLHGQTRPAGSSRTSPWPWSSWLKMKDLGELAAGGSGAARDSSRNITFCLDAEAFRHPSSYNDKASYLSLKRHLFSRCECQRPWVELEASPLNFVNMLADGGRVRAGIPSDATFFCFCYPIDSSDRARRGLDSQRRNGHMSMTLHRQASDSVLGSWDGNECLVPLIGPLLRASLRHLRQSRGGPGSAEAMVVRHSARRGAGRVHPLLVDLALGACR